MQVMKFWLFLLVSCLARSVLAQTVFFEDFQVSPFTQALPSSVSSSPSTAPRFWWRQQASGQMFAQVGGTFQNRGNDTNFPVNATSTLSANVSTTAGVWYWVSYDVLELQRGRLNVTAPGYTSGNITTIGQKTFGFLASASTSTISFTATKTLSGNLRIRLDNIRVRVPELDSGHAQLPLVAVLLALALVSSRRVSASLAGIRAG